MTYDNGLMVLELEETDSCVFDEGGELLWLRKTQCPDKEIKIGDRLVVTACGYNIFDGEIVSFEVGSEMTIEAKKNGPEED